MFEIPWYDSKRMCKVVGLNLPISRKKAYEVAKFIKYLPISKAKKILEDVKNLKIYVPFTRYNRDVPHRKGKIAKVKSGRYPVKVAKFFLKLLDSLEKNAQNKGFDTSKLIILDIQIGNGPKVIGRLRNRRVTRKRTHVLIIAAPIEKYDPNKKYKRKELKALVKEFVGW